LGPTVSDNGRTVYLASQRPFRYLTPDGVLLVFNGDLPPDGFGRVSIEQVGERCTHPLPPELECAGSWKVGYRVHEGSRTLEGDTRARFVRPKPAIDVLYPAPDRVPGKALFLDVSLVNTGLASQPRVFLLNGMGRATKTRHGQLVSVRDRFPVKGGGDLEEVEPTTIYNQDIAGVHHLLFDRSNALALVVGDYSGNNNEGDWHVSQNYVVMSPGSRLRVAAPLAVYGADIVAKEERTLAILPVIAGQQFELKSLDLATGWSGGSVPFEGVRPDTRHVRYIGDLDELRSTQSRGR
jgi:hypothetical protein